MMKYGFGVDVGGTTVKIGLMNWDGELLEKREIPTYTENGGEKILPDIASAVESILMMLCVLLPLSNLYTPIR